MGRTAMARPVLADLPAAVWAAVAEVWVEAPSTGRGGAEGGER